MLKTAECHAWMRANLRSAEHATSSITSMPSRVQSFHVKEDPECMTKAVFYAGNERLLKVWKSLQSFCLHTADLAVCAAGVLDHIQVRKVRSREQLCMGRKSPETCFGPNRFSEMLV